MTARVPGSSAPRGGTESALELLSAGHGRIEAHCASLRRLVERRLARGVDQEARSTAVALLRNFDSAAAHHHADEENDLFPVLIESMAGSDGICLREMIDGLNADRRALAACWRQLRRVLERIAAGEQVPLPADDVEALADLRERHIEREERAFLPMAVPLLSNDDLARVGRATLKRRGIDETQAAKTGTHRRMRSASWFPAPRSCCRKSEPFLMRKLRGKSVRRQVASRGSAQSLKNNSTRVLE